ncbi:Membrane protein involved in the export of O-antigen and teichoic acid [Chryseobacterium joostei]|uniref:Membrane protein involved in the export of O-antigen and teichoic acid n=1 Tax=Chryseobacterium joostei TaxID=112234 RepID=A0A1N7I0E8_9FLAO|nr:oligosaccharide flippase family protein [Chryseobacterium joostei]SIS30546.1 Membrane protein involved in the export of O-antigen and teichoic acid [Chryseobacterium joostei]SIS46158.1 Membrane protein involved in the export of O-antigen and teichoic acid [Chryseobacterium joostei]
MKKLKEIASKQSSLVFTDQLIFSGSNFLLTFLLARKLSISDFGFFSCVLLVTYFLVGICNAVIVQPFQISAAKEFSRKSLGFVFQAVLLLIFIFALLLFAAKFLPISAIEFFKRNLSAVILFTTAYIFQDFVRKILLTLDHIQILLFIDCIFLAVFPFIWVEESLSLFKSLYIIGIINFIATIPGIIYFIKNSDFSLKNNSLFRYHFKEGKWLLSASVVQWFSNNFFTLVAGIYLGTNALGALRLVQSFFGIINIILQTVENYYLPKTALLHYQNKGQEKKELLKNMSKGMAVLGVLIAGFFIFSEPIITFLGGQKYHQYGFVIRLISVLYIVILYGYPTRIAIRILEQNKVFFIGYCISFMFSLLSFHFLLKYFELYGAVSGLVINQVLMVVYWKILLNKKNISVWA